jgi:hypothetical protein
MSFDLSDPETGLLQGASRTSTCRVQSPGSFEEQGDLATSRAKRSAALCDPRERITPFWQNPK